MAALKIALVIPIDIGEKCIPADFPILPLNITVTFVNINQIYIFCKLNIKSNERIDREI